MSLAEKWRDCPTCGLPCETDEPVDLASTDGRVVHVNAVCVIGHRFCGPVEYVFWEERHG